MDDVFEAIARLRRDGGRGALATVIGTRGSTPGKETMRMLVREDRSCTGSVGGGCVEAEVLSDALEVLATEAPRRAVYRLTERETGDEGLACGGELEVFLEPVTAHALLIFGGGHVAKALCPIAATAGFRVTVVDDRARFASAERFPDAASVVVGERFQDAFPRLHVTSATSCVVVTRGHALDLACLDFALHTPAPYVGLIGSRAKILALLRRLEAAGRLDGVDLARLHAPIGLDLGGSSHGEISLAIAAELLAARRRVLGGLRTRRLDPEELRRALVPAAVGPRTPSPRSTGSPERRDPSSAAPAPGPGA